MNHPIGGFGGWELLRTMRQGKDLAGRRVGRRTARRVLEFARPYRWAIAVFLVTVVLTAGIGVATPVLAGNVINEIGSARAGAAGTIIRIALLIAVLAVLDALLSLAQRWYSARIGEGIILDLRRRVYDHVQRMPLQFFSRTQTGALISRLNNDVIGAQRAFTSTLSSVVSNIIMLVLTAGVMLTLSWQITVLSLSLLPLFIVPARRVGSRLAAITREAYQLDASMNATMTERFGVAGALLVKLFGHPDTETDRFADKAARVRDIGVQSAMVSRTFFVAMLLVASLAQALTYGLGGWLAVHDRISAGTVVTLALLLVRLYGPLTALSNVRVEVMSALVSFERVFEVLDLAPSIAERPGTRRVPPGSARIEFRDVHFQYPSAAEVSLASLEDVAALERTVTGPVLRGVSFTVEPGQVVALVGPSGAGKSTTAMLVPRIYDVTTGAVLVGGVDVREAELQSLRDTIGVVTQDAHLFHDTIAANLRYAKPGATTDELWAALDLAQIGDVVRSAPDGLATIVGERGYRFSGGEKQRIAIARLLLKAPSIVILDEATAHLDSESEAAVQRALAAALTGRTALVIAHRLSTVRDADLVLAVDGGRIVERGTHDELVLAGGLYSELYRTQFTARTS
ncbi:MAG: ABC transporter ATP-binding protein [Dactylosporangium sp.]|nr:ABC transporter ATP-binding protein/permease [Dactylosporangium sp.]NNJ60557.1 ABC transporter ATP-binding protein [Dactylosporangium sp.]